MQAMSEERLAKELHKIIIKNFKKRMVNSGSKDNIWGAYQLNCVSAK